jgi:hypothetical protein
VAALYQYDDGQVIRTTASFDFGSSGGGLFDEAGNLVEYWHSKGGPARTCALPSSNGSRPSAKLPQRLRASSPLQRRAPSGASARCSSCVLGVALRRLQLTATSALLYQSVVGRSRGHGSISSRLLPLQPTVACPHARRTQAAAPSPLRASPPTGNASQRSCG